MSFFFFDPRKGPVYRTGKRSKLVAYRIDIGLLEELKRLSELTGAPRTRLIEEALEDLFQKLNAQISKTRINKSSKKVTRK